MKTKPTHLAFYKLTEYYFDFLKKIALFSIF